MIPATLSEWTQESILLLLQAGIFEAEEFDFKESLPNSKDESGKERLRGSCSAFANTSGGFLVFGVADDRKLPAEQRLVGIESGVDFPANFGSYPQLCQPSVHWEFRNPPISLANGKLLHVIRISRSWKAPHCVGSAEQGFRFLKRTNKGNEAMSLEEVRNGFLGFYEKRIRLQLLQAELLSLQSVAAGAFISNQDEIGSHFCLVTFDTQIIQTVLADTYPVLAELPEIYAVLAQLRQAVNIANNKARTFFATANMPLSNKTDVTSRLLKYLPHRSKPSPLPGQLPHPETRAQTKPCAEPIPLPRACSPSRSWMTLCPPITHCAASDKWPTRCLSA